METLEIMLSQEEVSEALANAAKVKVGKTINNFCPGLYHCDNFYLSKDAAPSARVLLKFQPRREASAAE